MEVYESIAWVTMGFIPTIAAMEVAYRIARGSKIVGRREKTFARKKVGEAIAR